MGSMSQKKEETPRDSPSTMSTCFYHVDEVGWALLLKPTCSQSGGPTTETQPVVYSLMPLPHPPPDLTLQVKAQWGGGRGTWVRDVLGKREPQRWPCLPARGKLRLEPPPPEGDCVHVR